MTQQSLRCFEKPSQDMLLQRIREARCRMIETELLNLGESAQRYSLHLGAIMTQLRSSEIPTDRHQGLRNHAVLIRSQIDALLSLIPAQPTTATNQP